MDCEEVVMSPDTSDAEQLLQLLYDEFRQHRQDMQRQSDMILHYQNLFTQALAHVERSSKQQDLIPTLLSRIEVLEAIVKKLQDKLESTGGGLRSIKSEIPSLIQNQEPADEAEQYVLQEDTRKRIGFYNSSLMNPRNAKDRLRSRWPEMIEMSMDMDAYNAQIENVLLYENAGGNFYAVKNESHLYEIYFDPGFSVQRDQIKAMYSIQDEGEYVTQLTEPALFDADTYSRKLRLVQKGKLIAR
jgi:hypothetical protein